MIDANMLKYKLPEEVYRLGSNYKIKFILQVIFSNYVTLQLWLILDETQVCLFKCNDGRYIISNAFKRK